MTASIPMNWLTLQFPGDIEQDFLKEYSKRALPQARLAFLTGVAFFAGFGILDQVMIPDQVQPIWFIRYGIVCPLSIVLFILTYFPFFRRYIQGALSLSMLSGGLGIIAMPVVVRNPYFDDIYVALILVSLFSYTLTKLRFIYAAITGLVILIIYEVVAIFILNTPVEKLIAVNFGLFSANIIGMISCYLFERYIRQNFWQARLLQEEREKSERLLLNILPHSIAEQLKEQQMTIADNFAEATVLFADIAGFTKLSTQMSPKEIVGLLNDIFSRFDELVELHGLEKIKTIGDAYMVVGGLPIHRPDHAAAIADMALDMQQKIAEFNRQKKQSFTMRIGINTGPVVAGVIGIKKFIYDLWGDTVNTASRMESHGIAGQIQVTESTYEVLQDQYLFEDRGIIEIKGKGTMQTYLLLGRKVQPKHKTKAKIG